MLYSCLNAACKTSQDPKKLHIYFLMTHFRFFYADHDTVIYMYVLSLCVRECEWWLWSCLIMFLQCERKPALWGGRETVWGREQTAVPLTGHSHEKREHVDLGLYAHLVLSDYFSMLLHCISSCCSCLEHCGHKVYWVYLSLEWTWWTLFCIEDNFRFMF